MIKTEMTSPLIDTAIPDD